MFLDTSRLLECGLTAPAAEELKRARGEVSHFSALQKSDPSEAPTSAPGVWYHRHATPCLPQVLTAARSNAVEGTRLALCAQSETERPSTGALEERQHTTAFPTCLPRLISDFLEAAAQGEDEATLSATVLEALDVDGLALSEVSTPMCRLEKHSRDPLPTFRTPEALEKTLHYIFHHLVRAPRCPTCLLFGPKHHEASEYILNRLRQIRIDYTRQVSMNPRTVTISDPHLRKAVEGHHISQLKRRMQALETMVRFSIFLIAMRTRSAAGCQKFAEGKQITLESVDQCFTELIPYYRRVQRRRCAEMLSIVVFHSCCQLTSKVENSAKFCVLDKVEKCFEHVSDAILPSTDELAPFPEVVASPEVSSVLMLLSALRNKEWLRFFELCTSPDVCPLTPLQRAFIINVFSYVRLRAIADLTCKDLNSKTGACISRRRASGAVSIGDLAELLLFDDVAHCEAFLEALGLREYVNEGVLKLSDDDPHRDVPPTHETIAAAMGPNKEQLLLPPARTFLRLPTWSREQAALQLLLVPLVGSGVLSGPVAAFVTGADAASRPSRDAFLRAFAATTYAADALAVLDFDDVTSDRCPLDVALLIDPFLPPFTALLEGVTLEEEAAMPHLFAAVAPQLQESRARYNALRAAEQHVETDDAVPSALGLHDGFESDGSAVSAAGEDAPALSRRSWRRGGRPTIRMDEDEVVKAVDPAGHETPVPVLSSLSPPAATEFTGLVSAVEQHLRAHDALVAQRTATLERLRAAAKAPFEDVKPTLVSLVPPPEEGAARSTPSMKDTPVAVPTPLEVVPRGLRTPPRRGTEPSVFADAPMLFAGASASSEPLSKKPGAFFSLHNAVPAGGDSMGDLPTQGGANATVRGFFNNPNPPPAPAHVFVEEPPSPLILSQPVQPAQPQEKVVPRHGALAAPPLPPPARAVHIAPRDNEDSDEDVTASGSEGLVESPVASPALGWAHGACDVSAGRASSTRSPPRASSDSDGALQGTGASWDEPVMRFLQRYMYPSADRPRPFVTVLPQASCHGHRAPRTTLPRSEGPAPRTALSRFRALAQRRLDALIAAAAPVHASVTPLGRISTDGSVDSSNTSAEAVLPPAGILVAEDARRFGGTKPAPLASGAAHSSDSSGPLVSSVEHSSAGSSHSAVVGAAAGGSPSHEAISDHKLSVSSASTPKAAAQLGPVCWSRLRPPGGVCRFAQGMPCPQGPAVHDAWATAPDGAPLRTVLLTLVVVEADPLCVAPGARKRARWCSLKDVFAQHRDGPREGTLDDVVAVDEGARTHLRAVAIGTTPAQLAALRLAVPLVGHRPSTPVILSLFCGDDADDDLLAGAIRSHVEAAPGEGHVDPVAALLVGASPEVCRRVQASIGAVCSIPMVSCVTAERGAGGAGDIVSALEQLLALF